MDVDLISDSLDRPNWPATLGPTRAAGGSVFHEQNPSEARDPFREHSG